MGGVRAASVMPSGHRDRRFFRRQAFIALGLLAFPYAVVAVLTPRGSTYTGILFNPNDTFLYYAQMAHAQRGAWLFRDYFTYLPSQPLLAYTLYSAIGHIVPASTGAVGLALGFHVARLALAAAFMWQAWELYREATASRVVSRVGFLFLLFTSGAGVFQLLIPFLRAKEPPFDLLITESSSFAGLAFSPHFAAVLLGMVVYMRMVLRLTGRRGRALAAPALVGAVAALLAVTIHPDKAAVLAIGTVIFVAWQARAGRMSWVAAAMALGMLVPSIPYVLYSFSLTAADPQIRSLMAQGLPHEVVPDPLVYYGFGFGLPLLFALAGLPRLLKFRRRLPAGEALMWSFVVAGLAIILVPFHNVGHRAEGLQLALAYLAGRGAVREVMPRLWRSRPFRALGRRQPLGYSRRRLRLLTLNLAVILSSTSVLGLTFASPRAVLAGAPEASVTADDLAATGWLSTHAGPDDVAVGESTSSQFLVAYGGVRSAWGSFAYTPHYDIEGQRLAAFYLSHTDPQHYLQDRHIRWVYFGPREKRYARIRPDEMPFLTRTYSSGGTAIYEVTSAMARGGAVDLRSVPPLALLRAT
ncbi:MAG TPA: hypothetical protein VGR61_11940 [Candidatus Dormibacteraeota bacterium]|nr:hypothetical protein [Candidatus Dormibacteraeota bacterium]